jgi:hypothetical protein
MPDSEMIIEDYLKCENNKNGGFKLSGDGPIASCIF